MQRKLYGVASVVFRSTLDVLIEKCSLSNVSMDPCVPYVWAPQLAMDTHIQREREREKLLKPIIQAQR